MYIFDYMSRIFQYVANMFHYVLCNFNYIVQSSYYVARTLSYLKRISRDAHFYRTYNFSCVNFCYAALIFCSGIPLCDLCTLHDVVFHFMVQTFHDVFFIYAGTFFITRRLYFFSIWVSFHEHSRFTGEAIHLFNCTLYNFHPLHRHLDISRAITAGSSPLRIASSRTRTRYLWFPSAIL